ncbi:MAG: alpha/beta hydrolase fold protein [Phycisphaerales bacterium]|nr:alpha/beta hydrolase fold protein [Phycisphaerales bacterium]
MRIAQGRIHWRWAAAGDRGGHRPPIVLVHGLGVSGTYLMPVARELAAAYRVYVPDLPGSGQSDKPPRVLGVGGLADALRTWMDARRIGRAILLGQSMGCQVAVDLAMRFPERVERLILVAPTFDPAARSPFTQLFRFGADAFRESPSLALLAAADYLRAGPLRVLRTLHLAMQNHIEGKLPHLRVPTLVVTGSRDPIAPPAWAKAAAALVPRGQFAVIPGGPHGVNFSRPRELAALVGEFLK